MTQVMDQDLDINSDQIEQNYIQPKDTFDYKPVPMTAPVSLVIGLLSVTALVGVIGVLVAIAGIIVSMIATRKISKSAGMMSGRWLATTGLILSVLFFFSGTGVHAYAFQTEVPEGYSRISFSQQISKKKIGSIKGQVAVHRDILKLKDKPIFVKGFMYPQKQVHNLREFLLLKDTGECCFGGKPDQSDMILIKIPENKKGITHTDSRVSVAGDFRLRPDKTEEGLMPIYSIDAVMVEPSRTPF